MLMLIAMFVAQPNLLDKIQSTNYFIVECELSQFGSLLFEIMQLLSPLIDILIQTRSHFFSPTVSINWFGSQIICVQQKLKTGEYKKRAFLCDAVQLASICVPVQNCILHRSKE